ncbi:MAG: hypothetical protein R2856_07995 [Caldilineaceae bacterium]
MLRSGAPITITFAVSNLGPSLASSVRLSVTLPSSFSAAVDGNGRPLSAPPTPVPQASTRRSHSPLASAR